MAQRQDRPPANPAEAYERIIVPSLYAPLAEDLLNRAAPRPGERVLDVACGTGIVARRAALRVGPTGRVVGVDPIPGMLAVARVAAAAEGAAIEWRQGRGEALPVDGADFDLACCQQGLQYFQDRAAGLCEMRRALAPGGRLVLSVGQGLERQPFRAALDEIVARHVGAPLFTSSVFGFGDAAELRALLEGAGFRRVVVEPLSLMARFSDPAAFVRFQVLALAAVTPATAGMDAAAREATIAAVLAEAQAAVRPYVEDGALVLPTHAHVAQAHAD